MDFLPWYGPDPPQKLARAAARLDPDTREWSPFVGSWYASNISITGSGVIDGNGAAWWACAGNMSGPPCAGYPRPHGIRFVGGEGFAVSGVTIQNMPMWQVHLSWVSNVHVHDVRILAPARAAHNPDGACSPAPPPPPPAAALSFPPPPPPPSPHARVRANQGSILTAPKTCSLSACSSPPGTTASP